MTGKPLVLIADDDRQVLDALDTRLSVADFEVIAATTAREAVERFDQRQPNAAILDVELPDLDGLAVCEHIRKSGSDIPIFMLSGSDASIIRHHLSELTNAVGANHFLTKPYDGKALVMMLKTALQSTSQEPNSSSPSTQSVS